MPYVYDRNGKPVYVKPEDMLSAVEQKLIQLPANKKLNIINTKDGSKGTIGLTDLHTALKMGYRMEEENERVLRVAEEKYGDDEGIAALLGLASGFTAGLSNLGFEAAGVEVQQRKMANPTAYTGAEVVGMVGGALGPGLAARGLATVAKGAAASGLAASALKATSAITKASPAYNISRLGTTTAGAAKEVLLKTALGAPKAGIRGIATDALIKGGALAAGGAVEGALYGGVAPAAKAAIEILDESSLGNLDGVAESLVSQIGLTALIGGAAGGVFGVGGALGGSLLKKTSGTLTKAVGEKFGPEAAAAKRKATIVKSLGISDANLRKMGPQKVETFEKVLFEDNILDGPIIKEGLEHPEQILSRMKQAADESGKFIGAFTETMDDLVLSAGLAVDVTRPRIAPLIATIDEEIVAVLKRVQTKPTRQLLRDLRELRRDVDIGDLATFESAQGLKVDLRNTTNAAFKADLPVKGYAWKRIRAVWEGELDSKIDTVLNKVSDLPKTTKPAVMARPVPKAAEAVEEVAEEVVEKLPPVKWKTKTYKPAEMALKVGSPTRYIGSVEPLPFDEMVNRLVPAYKTATMRVGFSDIEIAELHRQTGAFIPLPQLLATLKKMSAKGQAVVSSGDWSISDESVRAAAIYLRPGKGDSANLVVRFKLDAIEKAKPWKVEPIELEVEKAVTEVVEAIPRKIKPPKIIKPTKLEAPVEVSPAIRGLDDIELPPRLAEIVEGKADQVYLLREHLDKARRVYFGLKDATKLSKIKEVADIGDGIASGAIQYGVRGMGWRLFGNTGVINALGRTAMGMGLYGAGRVLGPKVRGWAAGDIGTHLTRLNTAAKLGTITKRMETFQKKVNTAVDGILKTDPVMLRRKTITPISIGILRAITGEKNREKALEKYVDTLAAYNADPMHTADGVSASLAGLEEVAPQLAEKMAMLTTDMMAYLLSKAPKPSAEPSLQPLLEKPSYSYEDLTRFERIVAATLDPVSVLNNIPYGMVTKEEIQVLKDLYPTIFESARLQISMKAAETTKLFTNSQKRRLSQLFDIPLDRTATAGYLSRGKAVYQPQEKKEGKGVSGISVAGLGKLDDDDLPKMNQTTTSRIEGEL